MLEMCSDVINQPLCQKHGLLLMHRAVCSTTPSSQSALYFRLHQFVSSFVSPSITLSIIRRLFLSVSLFLLLSTSPSVILSNYQTQTNVLPDRQSLQVGAPPTPNPQRGWGETLLFTYTISIGISGNSPENQ